MAKFKVKTQEVLFYKEKEIEARTEDEATEKYFEMISEGNVEVINSDHYDTVATKQ